MIQSFPEECRSVIELLAEIYKNDGTAKEEKMTSLERLDYHRTHSGPLMETLHKWIIAQFEEKKVEPNSGLGKAFYYMLKRRCVHQKAQKRLHDRRPFYSTPGPSQEKGWMFLEEE